MSPSRICRENTRFLLDEPLDFSQTPKQPKHARFVPPATGSCFRERLDDSAQQAFVLDQCLDLGTEPGQTRRGEHSASYSSRFCKNAFAMTDSTQLGAETWAAGSNSKGSRPAGRWALLSGNSRRCAGGTGRTDSHSSRRFGTGKFGFECKTFRACSPVACSNAASRGRVCLCPAASRNTRPVPARSRPQPPCFLEDSGEPQIRLRIRKTKAAQFERSRDALGADSAPSAAIQKQPQI